MNVIRVSAAVLAAVVGTWSLVADAGERTPLVTGTRDAARLALGAAHSCVVGTDATVRGWGENGSGQFGDGTTTDRRTARPVTALTQVAAIAGDAAHTSALRAGTQHCSGSSWSDPIGPGSERFTPCGGR